MRYVLKRGGGRQRFSPAKLKKSIKKAARDAGASLKTKRELGSVAKEVLAKFKERKLIRAAEIRSAVLSRLSRKSRSVASAWKRYENKKRKAEMKKAKKKRR
jgi:transcriptional repressor NrdR